MAGHQHYDTAAEVAKILVQHIKYAHFDHQIILNVNIPDVPFESLKGFEITHLGRRSLGEPSVQHIDPRGQVLYWIGLPGKPKAAGPGTDFYAIDHNRVSITPLIQNWACVESMELLRAWVTTF